MGVNYPDISYFQGTVDAHAYLASGGSRIAMRATYGETGIDSAFTPRWAEFAGIVRQAYHFVYPGDPTVSVNHLVSVVNNAGGFHPDDEVMFDLEWFQDGSGTWQGLPPAQARQWALTAIEVTRRWLPDVRIFLYFNTWYAEAAGITEADFPNVGIITASYGSGYSVPRGFAHSCVWQFTDKQTVPGFPGEPVDCNTVVCPTDLAHLTIGDQDVLTPADQAWIQMQLGNQAKMMLSLIAQKIDNVTSTVLATPKPDGSDPDPTHYGIGDVGRDLKALATSLPGAVTHAVVEAIDAAPGSPVSTTEVRAALEGATLTIGAAK